MYVIPAQDKLLDLLQVTAELNSISDLDSLIENVLYQARRLTGAEAGTVFLKERYSLRFTYIQNDYLAARDFRFKCFAYTDYILPINSYSIAGYVAQTGQKLNLPNVRAIGTGVPYRFNDMFDGRAGYTTVSMLTIPLYTVHQGIIGVIQLINPRDDQDEIGAFTEKDEIITEHLARYASANLEKARATRETILRMIKMAELRDPRETGAHVNRVGSYAVEIYRNWAARHGLKETEINHYVDLLRLAAMLHDVGKVAISDLILKKPEALTPEEYDFMKQHTVLGAGLFANSSSELDIMATEIVMTHHERWDGTGYPNKLRGANIPLAGRIVALADVYDALISHRVYKAAWAQNEAIQYIRDAAGTHFDPELVDAFLEIGDTVRAIREKYRDE